jgi:hypothetical protein
VTASAVVTRLVWATAFWASAAHKTISEESFGFWIKELLDGSLGNQVIVTQRLPKLGTETAISFAIGATIVIKLDVKSSEVTLMGLVHCLNQCFFAPALLAGSNHDRGAMGIVSADIDTAVAAKFLKPDPDVSLDVLHQVPDVNRTICVGQGTGDENVACHGWLQLWSGAGQGIVII